MPDLGHAAALVDQLRTEVRDVRNRADPSDA
jgi:hypothetical protein